MGQNIRNRRNIDLSGDSLEDLAHQILKVNLEKLKIHPDDLRQALDSEEIHNRRVATRRLRAALKTFKMILTTKPKKIRVELQKVSQVLGKKRDLDIFSAFILDHANNTSLSFQKLDRLKDLSKKKILSMLKSNYYAGLIESLEKLKTFKTPQNILIASTKRIRKALKKVLDIAPSIDSKADDETLHKLRISIKKLRYLCEFFESVISPYIPSFSSFIEKMKKVQDILGDHQDAITGIAMLIRYKRQFSVKEFLEIKKKYEQRKKKTHQSFFKIWKEN